MIILHNFVAIDFPKRPLAKLLGKQPEGGRGGRGHAGVKGLVQKPKTKKKWGGGGDNEEEAVIRTRVHYGTRDNLVASLP